ncbi:nitronate monooxygenase [Tsuneonella sp. CC-YZS046]|uniref:NAD(P)H-dependent flavin oxidoreductase n=1 Tax=Tsuneonella sp. CC-YZS046 TaxID=3042152 RepID=UPI002D787B4F|nr:nitronate monooxygenase [Tsuneonella sp. CC-YZS046]WRO65104.1 nitronate monooxygenase [Tsuneonella sp. CC-YZS046]
MLDTRLTARLGLTSPVMLAPMALSAGGELAAACAWAGAFGMVGGGYGDLEWTSREWNIAANRLSGTGSEDRLGCGFITWKLDQDASALDWVLAQPLRPRAIFLSFGDPRPYARRIADAGIVLICQIQRIAQLPQCVEAGAAVIVAQGAEAGGHGAAGHDARSSFTLVPEVADWLSRHAPGTLLLGAGGVADGRGLAAMLMLGADGVVVGTRLWASRESLAMQGALDAAIEANGDATARSEIFDVLRRKNWPKAYDFRALRNAMHREWEGRLEELKCDPVAARAQYDAALKAGDFSVAHVPVGEGVGLIQDVPSAAELLDRMTREAARLLGKA